MFFQVIGAFIAILGVSVIMAVPKKYLFITGGLGAISWFVYLLVMSKKNSVYLATFLAAIIVSILAQFLARFLKSPVTLFSIAGILPLVPGAGMYRTVFYMIQNNNDLVSFYLTQTLQIAGLIAIAIFIVDSVFRSIRKVTQIGRAHV